MEVEILHLPQILPFYSASLKNKTLSEDKSREQICSQMPQGRRVPFQMGPVGAFWGKLPQESHTGGGDGTMCQLQARLCSLGILCWKHILRGHPINGLLQEKEQGPGRAGLPQTMGQLSFTPAEDIKKKGAGGTQACNHRQINGVWLQNTGSSAGKQDHGEGEA